MTKLIVTSLDVTQSTSDLVVLFNGNAVSERSSLNNYVILLLRQAQAFRDALISCCNATYLMLLTGAERKREKKDLKMVEYRFFTQTLLQAIVKIRFYVIFLTKELK